MDIENSVQENEKIMTDEEAAERAAKKEAAREARRKKKQRQKTVKTTLLIVLAVILVIAAAFAGFLLYLQKCGAEYDNITECVQSQPMDYSSRFSFSAEDKSVTMKMDRNDIWWLLYQTGAIDKLEKMDAAFTEKNLRLTGMGIDTTDESSLRAHLELACMGNIKIPMTADCAIALDESGINFSVAELRLGNGWKLPLRWICDRFDSDPSKLSIQISRDIHPFLADLRDITVTGGYVVATFDASGIMLSEAVANAPAVTELSHFGIESPAVPTVTEAASGTGTAAFDDTFASFAADPNAYIAFRSSVLALADEAAAAEYLAGPSAPYVQRFLPDLTIENINNIHAELFNMSAERQTLLETLASNLNTAYIKGTVAEPSAEDNKDKDKGKDKNKDTDKNAKSEAAATAGFVNKAMDGNPALTMEQLSAGNWASYSSWITEGDMRAVYIAGFANTTVEVHPSADDKDKDKDKNKNKDKDKDEEARAAVTIPAKPIGLMVRMKDGGFRLFYHEAAIADAASGKVNYTLTHVDIDSVSGEGYMTSATIPTVVYSPAMAVPADAAASVVPVDGAAPADTENPVDVPVANLESAQPAGTKTDPAPAA